MRVPDSVTRLNSECLPPCETPSNPAARRALRISRAGSTGRRGTFHLDRGQEERLFRQFHVIILESEFERLAQVRQRLLHGTPLAGDLNFRASCDEPLAFPMDDGGQTHLHAPPMTLAVFSHKGAARMKRSRTCTRSTRPSH